jgi:DNA-binding transcriptional ArsR family regulator
MQELSVTQLARQAGLDGAVLVTRVSGRKFLAELEKKLGALREGILVVVDFQGVEIMDASFADEVFGTLTARNAQRVVPSKRLILRGLSPANLENLVMALETRPQREPEPGLRNCVLPILNEAGQIYLIGKAEGHVKETFELLRVHKRLTARELADALNLDIHAASTRLKVIYNLGLALREEVRDTLGKQFVYVGLS